MLINVLKMCMYMYVVYNRNSISEGSVLAIVYYGLSVGILYYIKTPCLQIYYVLLGE